MKPRFVIATFVILALAVPASMLAQGSKAEQGVQASLAQLQQANLKGGDESASMLDKLLADEYVRIHPNGAIYTKAQILDGFRTGKTKIEKLDLSVVKVYIYGHTAVVTGVASYGGKAMNTDLTGQSRWTRIFVKRGSNWQCVLYQTTRIAS